MTRSDPAPGAATPEIIDSPGNEDRAERPTESIAHPGKIMRIGSMVKQLLEEVREADLDEAGRDRLADIYDTSLEELASTLSPDLQAELSRLTSPFDDDEEVPSGAELRIAQAQLVGWLEGLFQGIQAAMFAQQVAAQQQLEGMRAQLGTGDPRQMPSAGVPGPDGHRPGTYL